MENLFTKFNSFLESKNNEAMDYHQLCSWDEIKVKGWLGIKSKVVTVYYSPLKDKIVDIKSSIKVPFNEGDLRNKVMAWIDDNSHVELIKSRRKRQQGKR